MTAARFVVLALVLCAAAACTPARADEPLSYTPVVTLNGATLPWKMVDGVKEFHLTVEEVEWEMGPGMKIKAWGYNGRTPGPTIEAVEGDHVRIFVTNKLPERTAVHWHGLLLDGSGMDGVTGLTQLGIPPGDTFKYEFTLQQHGTQMYHAHGDEMTQLGLGAMGFFIIHPREQKPKIDRDYAIFLNEWFVEPGSSRPNPMVMTDFNIFTFNSRAYPGTAPLAARPGERVRIRIGHVGQDFHAIHLHGHNFPIVATDGGDIPPSAQQPETTIAIGPGQTRDCEFIARPGDWALHCHLRHHPMNAMGHTIPPMIGVDQRGLEEKLRRDLPGYMAMGQSGMEEMTRMQGMPGPENTLPMMAANDGPFGSTGMGGMFTILKVHDDIPLMTAEQYMRTVTLPRHLGWYKNPKGSVAHSVHPGSAAPSRRGATGAGGTMYVCPMHPEVRRSSPGTCPKCGMTLRPEPSGPASGEPAHREESPSPESGPMPAAGSGAGSHSSHH